MTFKNNALILLLTFVIVAQACLNDKSTSTLFGQENAMWCQSIYLRGEHPRTHEKLTTDMILKFGENLKKHHIKYAYLFAGPFQNDGHLPPYSFSNTAIQTVKTLKKNNPELIVLPWIGGVQNRTIHMEDSVWVSNAVSDINKLINKLDVKGVHLDFEYILSGDPYLDLFINNANGLKKNDYGKIFISFCKRVKLMMPKAFISTVVVADSQVTKPWKRKTSLNELKELIKYVDQINFLYYDTGINDRIAFESGCENLVKEISFLYSQKKIQYLIAIGTFINEAPLQKYRNMEIENTTNSIEVIKKQLTIISPRKKILSGMSLYCDWRTTEQDWNVFDTLWSRK